MGILQMIDHKYQRASRSTWCESQFGSLLKAEIQRQREACVKMGKNHSHRVCKHPLKGVSCSNIVVFAYKSGMRVF